LATAPDVVGALLKTSVSDIAVLTTVRAVHRAITEKAEGVLDLRDWILEKNKKFLKREDFATRLITELDRLIAIRVLY
jgi:hypothetical protein